MSSLPDEIVQQFRSVAIERLGRIETAWASVLSSLDDEAAVLVHRELHTLKGESKIVGFAEVNLVCHKLEDLLEVGRVRGYAVDEDFDLAVNMALRFMAMLVRKKLGAQLGGIDLPGFIRQIDTILAEIRPEPRVRVVTGQMAALRPASTTPRIPGPVRSRLGPIAVDSFIEYAIARGVRRDRLRSSWHTLRDLIGLHRAVVGTAQLEKHKLGALTVARELGKQVDVELDLGIAEVTTEMLGAIDTAVLHLLRNAVDHGIETPEERTAAGKPVRGKIRLQCGISSDRFTMTVEDDGRGVSFDEIRARAIDLGLITPTETRIESRWIDLVCQPGFTTRTHVNEVSGRGRGLDAVRVGVVESGGLLTASTRAGLGTTWNISLPLPQVTFDAHVFRIPGAGIPIAIDSSWQLLPDANLDVPVVDIAQRLGLVEDHAFSAVRHFFARDGITFGVICERAPQPSAVRRLVVATPPSLCDVVVVDAIEGLLVHLDRVFT